MQIDTLLTWNIPNADPCGRNIENNYIRALLLQLTEAGAKRPAMAHKETEPNVLQRQRTKGVKGWETESGGPCQTCYSNCKWKRSHFTAEKYAKKGNETSEEREMRLQLMRDRLAAEHSKEREWRLQTNQHAKLAVETWREITLQQKSTNQCEWLAVETPEERELRLEC